MKQAVIRPDRSRLESLIERLGHEDTPQVYTDRRLLVRELFWRRLDALLALSTPPARERALDFGGGNGVLTPTLARRYDVVVCVDLRTEMVEEIASANGLTNVEVRAGEISALRLPEASIDTVIAADVLEHVQDLEALVPEFVRLLKPGGELLVSAPTENRFYDLGRRVFGYTKPEDHYHSAAYIEGTLTRHLRLTRRRLFPVGLAPLAVFSLMRLAKPASTA